MAAAWLGPARAFSLGAGRLSDVSDRSALSSANLSLGGQVEGTDGFYRSRCTVGGCTCTDLYVRRMVSRSLSFHRVSFLLSPRRLVLPVVQTVWQGKGVAVVGLALPRFSPDRGCGQGVDLLC